MPQTSPGAIRAVLKKIGSPCIRFELHRSAKSVFEMFENGESLGAFFKTAGLREVWMECIARRYPEYEVSNMEEWVE